ncbi:hypothetical protein C8R44DRAFT_298709 [Mycena epipterygia]|nr:hypothetical protein C8R44DRAFT_298709 [Mycena epipterygia]
MGRREGRRQRRLLRVGSGACLIHFILSTTPPRPIFVLLFIRSFRVYSFPSFCARVCIPLVFPCPFISSRPSVRFTVPFHHLTPIRRVLRPSFHRLFHSIPIPVHSSLIPRPLIPAYPILPSCTIPFYTSFARSLSLLWIPPFTAHPILPYPFDFPVTHAAYLPSFTLRYALTSNFLVLILSRLLS